MDDVMQRFIVLVLAAFLTGCLGPTAAKPATPTEHTFATVVPSGLSAANRTLQEFYMVLIEGAEHAKPLDAASRGGASICDLAWVYDLDRNAETFRYDARRYPIDTKALQVLVVTNYHAPSLGRGIGEDCASKVTVSPFGGRAQFRGPVRPDLALDLVIEPQNGFVAYNNSLFAPMGKKIHVNFTRLEEPVDGTKYKVTGDFEVVNLGPWNRTGLEPVS